MIKATTPQPDVTALSNSPSDSAAIPSAAVIPSPILPLIPNSDVSESPSKLSLDLEPHTELEFFSKASKERIAANFGQSAQAYQSQATLQRQCANKIMAFLAETCSQRNAPLPDGPILEIGCGTGFITQHLINHFLDTPTPHHPHSKHSLHITDLSPDMVNFCQHHITLPNAPTPQRPNAPTPQLFFHTLDAETLPSPPQTYSLIIGGFVAQWFKCLANTVEQLLDQLKPGGILALSFPGDQSFPEWREWCDRLNLPYTAHPLPNPHTLIQQLRLSSFQHKLHTEMCPTYYSRAKAFFKSMKVIGAGASDAGKHLSPVQMRQLLKAWDNAELEAAVRHTHRQKDDRHVSRIKVHYQIIYLSILKA
ncbi:MAG: methyltransferase [Cyanobacteria bacterium P01_F01_bin.150]